MEKETFTTPVPRRKKFSWVPPVLLLLFAYIFWQAYLVNFNGVDTVKATEGYINDSIISQGIVCRDEVVLTRSSTGSVDYLLHDGERVSRGALLANAYSSSQDVENLVYLRNREGMLDDINSAIDYLYGSAMDVSVAKKQLTNEITTLSQMNSSGNYSGLYDSMSSLIFSLNKIAVATGRATDFGVAKRQIENEVGSVKAQIGAPVESLYASYTGYFITDVDGFENVATENYFANISYDEGIAILSSSADLSPAPGAYGKIITDYKWSLCTYVDTDKCGNLAEGKTVNISISVKENNFNKATIKKMVEMGDKTLIIAQCSIMDSYSATARLCDCEILFKQHRGIKIPKTAIHFENGQMGVYVNYSNVVQFKQINPVFEDENYVIVPLATSADNQVKLYDSIIVKGRNLYDGKYL